MMRRQKDTLLVYPAIGRVDPKLLARFTAAERSGAMLRPRCGGHDEFYGVKEFRRGENPRLIHWKRSARTGTLVAKEMTLVSPPRLLLLVDTYHPDGDSNQESRGRIEQTIAMAGSLASHALESGLMVGLCAWSTDGWITLPPNRGKRHAKDVMATLATLPDNTSQPSPALMARAEPDIKSGTTPVLLTPSDMDVGLPDRARGGLLVLSPTSLIGQAAIQFDPAVDFEEDERRRDAK
jgi:uncharacterized protein (DUF58 family)